MSRPTSLALLVASLLAVAAAYASAFVPGGADRLGAPLLLVGSVGGLVAVSLLGASGEGRAADRRLLAPLAAASLLVMGGIGSGFLLPDPSAGDRLWGGLPAGAALLVYGAGLLPLLVVPLAYAWTFSRTGFDRGDLERIAERARAAVEDGAAGERAAGDEGAAGERVADDEGAATGGEGLAE